jgi:hypothetical protein
VSPFKEEISIQSKKHLNPDQDNFTEKQKPEISKPGINTAVSGTYLTDHVRPF